MCILRMLFVVALLAILAAAQRDSPERETRAADAPSESAVQKIERSPAAQR